MYKIAIGILIGLSILLNANELTEKGKIDYRNENFQAAFEFFQKAADGGDPEGKVKLGIMHKNGEGTDQNTDKAIELFQKAADLGSSDALIELGDIYYDGSLVKKDINKAIELYQKAGDAGSAKALGDLGNMFQFGRNVEEDPIKASQYYKRAFALLLQGAKQKNIKDQALLAGVYRFGSWGIEPDFKLAIQWYQKAAKAGDIDSQSFLGVIYDNGKNYPEAAVWYQKAADKGDSSSQFLLAILYSNGVGIKKDLTKAKALYTSACDNGNKSSCTNLGNMHLHDKAYFEAVKLFRKTCDSGDAMGCNNLGTMYSKGNGVRQDFQKAHELFGKACDAGEQLGCQNYAN